MKSGMNSNKYYKNRSENSGIIQEYFRFISDDIFLVAELNKVPSKVTVADASGDPSDPFITYPLTLPVDWANTNVCPIIIIRIVLIDKFGRFIGELTAKWSVFLIRGGLRNTCYRAVGFF